MAGPRVYQSRAEHLPPRAVPGGGRSNRFPPNLGASRHLKGERHAENSRVGAGVGRAAGTAARGARGKAAARPARPAARDQRSARPPPAEYPGLDPDRLLQSREHGRRADRLDPEDHARRRHRLSRDMDQEAPDGEPEHGHGGRRRPDRREPARLGAVPRRADDRGDELDRHGRGRCRQPRVRRGDRGAAADADRQPARRRRLPSRRWLPGRNAVRRLAVPVPRGERLLRGHGRDDLAALRDPQGRQREDRVPRAHLRGHANRGDPERRRRPRVPARDRDRQRARRQAPQRAGCEGVRRAPAPGRLPAGAPPRSSRARRTSRTPTPT